ncbi:MAG: dTMP kinase [Dehalococcoidia bacterium]
MSFLVLEGLDGAGTTTQRSLLTTSLRKRGLTVLETWEPTDGPVGQVIRRFLTGAIALDPAALALLFAADRLDHLRREVRPALEAGNVVVCDRYLLSSLAYQSIDLDGDWVARINREADQPDLTIVLAISPEAALDRITRRGQPAEHYERLDRLRAVARAYRRAIDAARLAGAAVVMIAGDRAPEDVAADVLAAATRALGRSFTRPHL